MSKFETMAGALVALATKHYEGLKSSLTDMLNGRVEVIEVKLERAHEKAVSAVEAAAKVAVDGVKALAVDEIGLLKAESIKASAIAKDAAAWANGAGDIARDATDKVDGALATALAGIADAEKALAAKIDEGLSVVGKAVGEANIVKSDASAAADEAREAIKTLRENVVKWMGETSQSLADTLDDFRKSTEVELTSNVTVKLEADSGEFRKMIDEAIGDFEAVKADIEKAVSDGIDKVKAAIPEAVPGPRGASIKSVDTNRAGNLVITFDDGSQKDVGRVDGKDGADGLGFDDMEFKLVGERSFSLEFTRGDKAKSFNFTLPVAIYRGQYDKEKAYEAGDMVTFGGEVWHFKAETGSSAPGVHNPDWEKAVARGLPGGKGDKGEPGKKGKDGLDGKNLTSILPNGVRM